MGRCNWCSRSLPPRGVIHHNHLEFCTQECLEFYRAYVRSIRYILKNEVKMTSERIAALEKAARPRGHL